MISGHVIWRYFLYSASVQSSPTKTIYRSCHMKTMPSISVDSNRESHKQVICTPQPLYFHCTFFTASYQNHMWLIHVSRHNEIPGRALIVSLHIKYPMIPPLSLTKLNFASSSLLFQILQVKHSIPPPHPPSCYKNPVPSPAPNAQRPGSPD